MSSYPDRRNSGGQLAQLNAPEVSLHTAPGDFGSLRTKATTESLKLGLFFSNTIAEIRSSAMDGCSVRSISRLLYLGPWAKYRQAGG